MLDFDVVALGALGRHRVIVADGSMKPQDRTRAILRSGLDTEAKIIAIAIADYLSDDAGRAWPSMPTLSRDTGLTTRTLRRRVAVGVADGWLDTERRTGGSTRYALVWSSPWFAPCDVTPDRESARTGSHPGQAVRPTPDTESTEVDHLEATTDSTMGSDHPASPPQPTNPNPEPEPPMSRSDDLDATADGYRNGRTTPNLSTDTEPEALPLAPDGRPIPPTWSALLGPVVQRLPPGEAGAAANVIRALLRVYELAPRYLLAIPGEDWKYQRGIGGEARANLLADLATRAGWPPGCLAPPPVVRLTEGQALDLLSDDDQLRWLDGGLGRDRITGHCILPPPEPDAEPSPSLRVVKGGR